jgi:hypothetical protein
VNKPRFLFDLNTECAGPTLDLDYFSEGEYLDIRVELDLRHFGRFDAN